MPNVLKCCWKYNLVQVQTEHDIPWTFKVKWWTSVTRSTNICITRCLKNVNKWTSATVACRQQCKAQCRHRTHRHTSMTAEQNKHTCHNKCNKIMMNNIWCAGYWTVLTPAGQQTVSKHLQKWSTRPISIHYKNKIYDSQQHTCQTTCVTHY